MVWEYEPRLIYFHASWNEIEYKLCQWNTLKAVEDMLFLPNSEREGNKDFALFN